MSMLWLNSRGIWVRRALLVGTFALLVLAHYHLWVFRNVQSISGYYHTFIAAMVIWAWHELAFYSGIITGPRTTSCPTDADGWQRLRCAIETHLYHIGAIGCDTLVLWWLHQNATNKLGFHLFVMLWVFQLSAKLNILLGMRNFEPRLLPKHMRYLGSYWTNRPYNRLFFPIVLLVGVWAVMLWIQAIQLAPSTVAIGTSFLATAATLGFLEHIVLVLPPSRSVFAITKPDEQSLPSSSSSPQASQEQDG
jgi:putative photosynthetic complex assembly protein 2